MSSERKTTEGAMKTGPTHAATTVPSAARRRLLRGGLAVAPVVMASAPRSVMAGGAAGVCVPASSFASVNTSRPDSLSYCSGRSPDFWKERANFRHWHVTRCLPEDQGLDKATKFNVISRRPSAGDDMTLLQVLKSSGGDREAVARHIVAAFLNARAGLTSPKVLSVDTVRDIWSSFERHGYYEPTAGIKWDARGANVQGAGGIIPWLTSTMRT